MHRILGELGLLIAGLALGIALVFVTTLSSVGHPGAYITEGYPWLWRWAASASPGGTYLVSLVEDVAFWLALSLALVELPVRFAVIYLERKFNRSGSPALPSPGGQFARASIIIASAIVVAALLISASTFAAIGGPVTTTLSLTTTFTSTSTSVSISTTTTTHTVTTTILIGSADALQLQLSATTSGGAVNVSTDDFNLLSYANNVTAEDEWLIPLESQNVEPCWMDSWPVGFAVASGHYTASNITTAKLLDLVNPGVTYSCSLTFTFGYPAGFLFSPQSDIAAEYGCQISPYCQNIPTQAVSLSLTLTGYWRQGGSFTNFPSGTYTVLGEDEWGHSVLAYFTVS